MTATAAEIHTLVGEFLAVLDEAIRLQETAVDRLKGLCDAVTARNEAALRQIIDDAGMTSAKFAAVEHARQALSARLAAAVGCGLEEVTLSRLVRRVSAEDAQAIEERRRRITALGGDIRRQHRRTAAFVGECAHVNRAFLLGLFPEMESVKTYGHRGGHSRGVGAGLLDARS
jgi:hypothetical protein